MQQTTQQLGNKTIVIGILARDCVNAFKRNIPGIEKLGKYFKDYHVIIYENDSKDGTDILAKNWEKSNSRVMAICEKTGEKTIPHKTKKIPSPGKSVYRISRMIKFRNKVLDIVRERFSPDYFCFIDIDLEYFNSKSIVDAITNAPANWGGLFANGSFYYWKKKGKSFSSPLMYDTYAFFFAGVEPRNTDDWAISKHFHKITGWTAARAIEKRMYLPVRSAFNGIGIYRWEAIKDLRYRMEQTEAMLKTSTCFCEHVPFNGDVIKKGYKLYVAREMRTIYLYKKLTLLRRYKLWEHDLRIKFMLKFRGPYPVDYSL